jgi:hypothetical protein
MGHDEQLADQGQLVSIIEIYGSLTSAKWRVVIEVNWRINHKNS